MSRTQGTTAAGYGWAHQKARRTAIRHFQPGQPCARCGQPIHTLTDPQGRSTVDLGHTDDRTGYHGLEHATCNRQAAAQNIPRHRPRRSEPHPGLRAHTLNEPGSTPRT